LEVNHNDVSEVAESAPQMNPNTILAEMVSGDEVFGPCVSEEIDEIACDQTF
jgi:hypothetical protein